ncbi:MAG: methyltransferase domain-containing protein [Elusimicrobia bacterium]|nr:methyltransferase domain-containing protein [Elusimicrobiota bacterium]
MSEPAGFGTMAVEMSQAVAYYDWLADVLRPWTGKRILEVGPGYGSLAERLAAEAEAYVGLDDSEPVVAHLAKVHTDKPAWRFFKDGRLGADHVPELEAARLDTVLAVNLLEHLPDEGEALRLWGKVCRGGRLVAMVPAGMWLYGSLDEQAGHYRRYSRAGFGRVLESHGLRVERLHYLNAVGALGWFVVARLLRRDIGSGSTGLAVRVYDSAVLPAARLVDPLLRPFWGQSVVAVARFPD